MKRSAKIVLFIHLGIIGQFLLCLAALGLNILIDRGRLDFKFSGYSGEKKTPPSGQVNPIALDMYQKDEIMEHLGDCKIFPDDLLVGEASMLLSFDPLYQDRAWKRGQAFLEWKMSSDIFDLELTRMKELIGNKKSEKKTIWSNDLFDLPSCIAEYNHLSGFEYALLDKEAHIIRYVHFFDIESLDNVLFPVEWAPTKPMKDSDVKNEATVNGRFSFYTI